MPKKKPARRKPSPARATVMLTLRLTRADADMLRSVARAADTTVADWIRLRCITPFRLKNIEAMFARSKPAD